MHGNTLLRESKKKKKKGAGSLLLFTFLNKTWKNEPILRLQKLLKEGELSFDEFTFVCMESFVRTALV